MNKVSSEIIQVTSCRERYFFSITKNKFSSCNFLLYSFLSLILYFLLSLFSFYNFTALPTKLVLSLNCFIKREKRETCANNKQKKNLKCYTMIPKGALKLQLSSSSSSSFSSSSLFLFSKPLNQR